MNVLRLGIVADEISRDFREAVRIGTQAGLRRYEVRFLCDLRAPAVDPSWAPHQKPSTACLHLWMVSKLPSMCGSSEIGPS